MRILFQKAKYGGITGRLISIITRGPYFHCEIAFNNSTECFSADSNDGVRYLNRGSEIFNEFDCVELPDVDPEIKQEVWRWTQKQLGKPYDWVGVFGFVLPWLHDDKNDWFCSEICCEVLVRLGLLAEEQVRKVDPNKLAKIVKDRYMGSWSNM